MAPDHAEKKRRLLEAAMAVLEGAPGRALNITNLNKALFWLDLVELRDEGHTVTGATYVALPQGPVVAKYPKHLVKPLVDAGLATQEQVGDAKPVIAVKAIDHFDYLDQRARERAAEMGGRVAKRTAAALSEQSHRNPGWRAAYAQSQAGGSRVIDIHLALQEVVDDDPWLADLDAVTEEAFTRAHAADEGLRW